MGDPEGLDLLTAFRVADGDSAALTTIKSAIATDPADEAAAAALSAGVDSMQTAAGREALAALLADTAGELTAAAFDALAQVLAAALQMVVEESDPHCATTYVRCIGTFFHMPDEAHRIDVTDERRRNTGNGSGGKATTFLSECGTPQHGLPSKTRP